MPALKNPRHEAFAQAHARGMSASAAYVEAGYKANRHNAAAAAVLSSASLGWLLMCLCKQLVVKKAKNG